MAWSHHDEPKVAQFFVGLDDRSWVDPKLVCQGSNAWKTLLPSELPTGDTKLHLLDDLSPNGLAAVMIEMNAQSVKTIVNMNTVLHHLQQLVQLELSKMK